MVFRTFDTDVKGLSSQLGIFGKSFKTISSEVNQSLDGVEGRLNRFKTVTSSFFKSVFTKPVITKNDSIALLNYAEVLENSNDSNEAFAKTMSNASEAAREQSKVILDLNKQYKSGKISKEQYIEQCETAAQSTENLTSAQKTATVASKALGVALRIALNIGVSLLIDAIIKGIEYLITAVDKQKEHLEDLASEYEKAQSEVEAVNEKIKENKRLIDEINKNPLSVTSPDTLTTLENENKQLEAQYEWLKNIAEIKKRDLYKETEDFLTSENQESGVNKTSIIAEIGTESAKYFNAGNYAKAWLSATSWQQALFNGGVNRAVSYLEQAQEYIDELNRLKDEQSKLDLSTDKGNKRYDEIKKLIEEYESKLVENNEFLSSKLDSINPNGEVYKTIQNIIEQANNWFTGKNITVETGTTNVNNNVDKTSDSIDNLNSKLTELKETYTATFDNQDTFQTALDKIKNGTALTSDEVLKLRELCPELATQFSKTADGWTISAENIISANEKIVKSTKEEIQAQIDGYQKIIDTYNKNKLSPLVNNPSGMPSYVSSMYANLAQLASDAEEAQKQIDFLNLVLQMFGFTVEETASTSIDKLSSIKSIIKDFKEEIDDGGKLTISTLQKAIEKYPQLENSLSEYLAGLKSQEDIYDELVDCYNQDLDNFKTYLANKSIDDENTWDKFVENSGDWVNSLADMYALDLAHLKTYKQFSDELKNSISNNIPDSTAALAHYQNLERQSFEEFKGLFGNVDDIINESNDNSSSSVTLPEEYTKLKKALEHEYAMGKKTAKEYYTELNSLAIKWLKDNAEYADEYMSVQETVYSGLKSLYSEVVNEQIEGYENVLDVLKNINQEKIDSLNKEKELLEDNADEEQRILDLKQAQLDLENAKKRTTWVITEQGLKQVQDEKGVKEAQDALDKLELESKTSQIDKKIKALEDENNKYDKIKTDWQNKTNIEEAKKFIGSDNIKGAVSEGFKEGYINALNEKQSIENADKSTNKASNPVTIDYFLKKLGSKYTFDEIKDKAYNLAFSPYAFNSFVENIKTTTDNIVNNINNNNSSKIGDINIVINDATDPEKVGNVVVKKLTDIATKWSNSSGRYLRSNF